MAKLKLRLIRNFLAAGSMSFYENVRNVGRREKKKMALLKTYGKSRASKNSKCCLKMSVVHAQCSLGYPDGV